MMSMPSSLIGFALFKTFSAHLSYPFTPTENGNCLPTPPSAVSQPKLTHNQYSSRLSQSP